MELTSKVGRSSARLDVSEIWTGTPSGVLSGGSFVTGSTGGGESGNDSVAAAVMRLVLPTPSSPMTQTRTGFLLRLSIPPIIGCYISIFIAFKCGLSPLGKSRGRNFQTLTDEFNECRRGGFDQYVHATILETQNIFILRLY